MRHASACARMREINLLDFPFYLYACGCLARTRIEYLRTRLIVIGDKSDRAGKRIRTVIMCGKREVHELLNELGIVLIPRVKELELPARVMRLDAFDASELGRIMPDEFVWDGEADLALALLKNEFKVRELGIGLRLTE